MSSIGVDETRSQSLRLGAYAFASVVLLPNVITAGLFERLTQSPVGVGSILLVMAGALWTMLRLVAKGSHSPEAIVLVSSLLVLYGVSSVSIPEPTTKLNTLYLGLGCIAAGLVGGWRDTDRFLVGLGGAYALLSLIWEAMVGSRISIHGLPRLSGIAGNVNVSYVFLTLCLASALGVLATSRRQLGPSTKLVATLALLMLAALGMTFSRNAIIGLAVVGAATIYWFKPSSSNRIAIVVAVVAMAALITGARGQHLGYVAESRYAVQGRGAVWTSTFDIARDQPWLGVGIGRYRSRVIEESSFWTKDPKSPFLLLFAEAGALGALLAGLLVAVQVRMAWRRENPAWLRLAVLGLLAVSILDSPYLAINRESGSALLSFLLLSSCQTSTCSRR